MRRYLWAGLLISGLMLGSIGVQASMRCAGGLVNEGDSLEQVLALCGEPVEREIERPHHDEDGFIVRGAVEVEHWRYGPDRGMYRTLRFIDGRLVEIRSRRN